MRSGLPNFFLIGAAKSMTTSLASSLSMHPDVYIPAIKEPDFFSWDTEYLRGLKYYSKLHYRETRAASVGDASVSYFTSRAARERISRDLPAESHRFIVILRDPVERAYSHYSMNRFQNRIEQLSFEDALLADRQRRYEYWAGRYERSYLASSEYGSNISAWMDQFPHGRFHFLTTDSFLHEHDESMIRLFDFLGLERFSGTSRPVRENSTMVARVGLTGLSMRLPERIKHPVRRLAGARAIRRAMVVAAAIDRRPVQPPPLDAGAAAELRSRLREEILLAQELTGLDLSKWLV